MSGGWIVGPTSNISFIDIPVDDLADASNTALILVVVLDSFWTVCIGDERYFQEACLNQQGGHSQVKVLLHDSIEFGKLTLTVQGVFKREESSNSLRT